MAPYLPIYNQDNLGGYQGPSAIDGNDAENPVRVANLGYQKINNFSLTCFQNQEQTFMLN